MSTRWTGKNRRVIARVTFLDDLTGFGLECASIQEIGTLILGIPNSAVRRKSKLPTHRIRRWQPQGLIATPTIKSIRRFRDQVRLLTRRCDSRKTEELIRELNPTLRGWGEYYKRAHVRTLFHRLDRWIVRRIWSHRFRRWQTWDGNNCPGDAIRRDGLGPPVFTSSYSCSLPTGPCGSPKMSSLARSRKNQQDPVRT
jgi:hypothetical protein